MNSFTKFLLVFALVFSIANASASGPKINLFPQSVISEFQSSVNATKSMEEKLQPIVKQMELSQEQIKASQCDNTSADAGCAQHRKVLQQQFIAMLDEFEKSIPTVEKSLKATNQSLGKSISRSFSTFTPRELQKQILQGKKTAKAEVIKRVRSKRMTSLSQRFKQYLDIVSAKGSSTSLTTTAAEMYLETGESLEYINSIKDQIGMAKAQAQIDLQMNMLSDEMVSTVSWAKSFIFGDFLDEQNMIPDDSPLGASNDAGEDYSDIEL